MSSKDQFENEQKRHTQPVIESIPDAEVTHYWLYSPGNRACIWDECYENGIMAIGWDDIGDLSQYPSKTAIREAMQAEFDPDRT